MDSIVAAKGGIRWLMAALLIMATAAAVAGAVEVFGGVDDRRAAASAVIQNCDKVCEREGVRSDRRSATAAEDMVDLGIWQLAVGAAGLVLVGLTFAATSAAVRESANSASAAHAAVGVAKDTAQHQLRPYIFRHQVGVHGAADPKPPHPIQFWYIDVQWKNVGQTPARRVNSSINWAVFPDEGPPADFSYPDNENFNSFIGSAGPGQEWGSTASLPIDEIADAYAKNFFVHFWAWTEYDSFPGTARHRTEVHGRAVYTGTNIRAPVDGWRMEIVRTFNGFDETCLRPVHT